MTFGIIALSMTLAEMEMENVSTQPPLTDMSSSVFML